MNNAPLLLLFATALIISTLTATIATFKAGEQINQTSTVLGTVSQRVSNVFQVISAYTEGVYTYFLVSGYSGQVPLRALTAVIDGAPYDVNVKFVKDLDGDGILDPSDVAYIIVEVPFKGEHDVSFISQAASVHAGKIVVEEKEFKYRRVVNIKNETGESLSDYQVRVELNASNFDFTHIQPDCSDIRFTDTSNHLLSFWIEVCDPAHQKVVIWVKVPSIPAGGETNIYLYYGAVGVLSFSNGESTFIFFDDFTDLSKWNCTSGNEAECEHVRTATVDGRSVVVLTSKKNDVYLTTVDALSGLDDVAIEAMIKRFGNADDVDLYIGVDNDSRGYPNWGTRVGDKHSGQYHAVVVDESIGNQGNNTYIQSRWLICHIYRQDNKITSVYNGEELSDTAESTPLTTGNLFIRVDPDTTDRGAYMDWIRVRKYVSPEPTVTVGEEEHGSYTIG